MRSKTFVILLILIPLLLIAGAVFYYFRSAQTALEKGDENTEIDLNFPKLLISEQVISPVLSFDGEKIWYMIKEGRMFRVHLETGETEEYLLPEPIEGPIQIIWQKDGGHFIMEQNVGGHAAYNFFDGTIRKFTLYPPSLTKPQFIPGNRIVYDWVSADLRHSLNVSDADTRNFRKVADLFQPDNLLVASPLRNEVAIFTANAAVPFELYLVNLDTGEFQGFGESANYQGVKFSPDGSKLLAARVVPDRFDNPVELVIYDLVQSSAVLTGIFARIEQAGWSADGREIIVGNMNGFSRFDLGSSESQNLYAFGSGEDYAPVEVFTRPGGSTVFFVDERTGYLYQLDLE